MTDTTDLSSEAERHETKARMYRDTAGLVEYLKDLSEVTKTDVSDAGGSIFVTVRYSEEVGTIRDMIGSFAIFGNCRKGNDIELTFEIRPEHFQ